MLTKLASTCVEQSCECGANARLSLIKRSKNKMLVASLSRRNISVPKPFAFKPKMNLGLARMDKFSVPKRWDVQVKELTQEEYKQQRHQLEKHMPVSPHVTIYKFPLP